MQLEQCTDPREKWITNRIMSFLDANDEALIARMLDRGEGRARRKLREFIEGRRSENQIFFVYKTFYLKTFYKEVTIYREVPRPKGVSPQPSLVDDDAQSDSADDDKAKKIAKRKKGKKGNEATDDGVEKIQETLELELEPSEPVDEEEDSPGKRVKIKKDKAKSIKRPKSPASVVETLPSEYAETETMTIALKPSELYGKDAYVYFILRSLKGIPIICTDDEATAEMPKYIFVGQCSSDPLEDFIVKCKIMKLYCFHTMPDKFDTRTQLTEGLERIVPHRRKDKGSQPRLDEYQTAASFAQLVIRLNRSAWRRDKKAKLLVKESFLASDALKKLKSLKSCRNLMTDLSAKSVEKDALMRVLTVSSILSRMVRKPQNGEQSLKGNFLGAIERLENACKWCSLHNSSTSTFKLPKLQGLRKLTQAKVHALVENQNYFNFLVSVVKFWAKYIDAFLKKYGEQLPEGKGPLALYEYWRVRCEELSPVVDECFQPTVKNLMRILQMGNSSVLAEFKGSRMRLRSYFKICSENTEYLEYIIKELKFLTHAKSLKPIIWIIPQIMDSLRVIWVLSSYWGNGPYFIELLKRIRWVLCSKVTKVLNVPKLFSINNEAARTACFEAVQVMETWKSSYANTRAIIETTKCEERWEFDRDLLFHETDYISQVANSLLQILSVVDVYRKIFSPKFMESVTDPTKIDKIQHKIQDLVNPITTSDFNIFDRDFSENWKIILEYFWNELGNLERDAIDVINYSFSSLRSASKSLSLLSEMQDCRSGKILDLLNRKYDDIMIQFSEEVQQLLDAFTDFRQQPVVLRNHPMTSGSLYWARGLVMSLKHTLNCLLKTKEVYKTKTKDEALEVYSNFVEMISKYEKNIFVKWLQDNLPETRKLYVTNILKLTPVCVAIESNFDGECWSFLNKRQKKLSGQLHSKGRKIEANAMRRKADVTESESISGKSNFVGSSSFIVDKSIKKSLNEIIKSSSPTEIDEKMVLKNLSEFNDRFVEISWDSSDSEDVDLNEPVGEESQIEKLQLEKKRRLSRLRLRKIFSDLNCERRPKTMDFEFNYEEETKEEDSSGCESQRELPLKEGSRSCSSSEIDVKSKVRERMRREKSQLEAVESPESRYSESFSGSERDEPKESVGISNRKTVGKVQRPGRTIRRIKKSPVNVKVETKDSGKRYFVRKVATFGDSWFYERSDSMEMKDLDSEISVAAKILSYMENQARLKSIPRVDSEIREITEDSTETHTDSFEKSPLKPTLPGKIHTGCRHDVVKYPWWQFIGEDVLLEHGYAIATNVKKNNNVVLEAQIFNQLGFRIPSRIDDFVALRYFFHDEVIRVEEITRKYVDVVEKLKPSQILALKPAMRTVEQRIAHGFTYHTWSSLSIPEFCDAALESLNRLDNLRSQFVTVQNDVRHIFSVVRSLDFFQFPESESDEQTFFEFVENRRNDSENELRQSYDNLSRQMLKLESALFQENSRMNEFLILCYMEAQFGFYEALIEFTLFNLKKYKKFLDGQQSIFSVDLSLTNFVPCLQPEATRVAQILAFQAEDLIFRMTHFPRWKEGTCVRVPHLLNLETVNYHRFSYAEDLIRHEAILSELNSVYRSISTIMESLDRFVESWKPVSHIWSLNVELTVEKFINDDPTLAEYDECFLFYGSIIKELDDSSNYEDVFCVRVQIGELIGSIKQAAIEWKKVLGLRVLESARQLNDSIGLKMTDLKVNITRKTNDLDSYQRVLQAIKDCCDFEVEARLVFTKIADRIHLLKQWNVPDCDNMDDILGRTRADWATVKQNAAYRSATLKPSMRYFTTSAQMTSDRFVEEMEEFGARFRQHGPGTCTNDLDRGLELVKSFKGQFSVMLGKIESTVQAEILFDLPPGNFDSFQEVYRLYTMIEIAFAVYEKQKAKEIHWHQTRWSNFNGDKLKQWAHKVLEEIARLPRECLELDITLEIRRNVEKFLMTVELMVKLQNKVLRERHWKDLMSHTGCSIEYEAHDFQLREIFKMKLYEHAKLVEEILLNANREKEIEEELCILIEHWSSMEIPLSKYPKYCQEDNYNYILSSFDVIRDLDESSIRVQAMEYSRFSTPFDATIKLLLKQLTQIVEVLKLFEYFYKEWSSLALIFTSEANEDLASAKKQFTDVEASYFEINRHLKNKPNLMEQFLQKCRMDQIQELLIRVENIRKSVKNFLIKKCVIFPRFNLLSEEEMFDLFGNNHLSSVQRCVKKIFEISELLETQILVDLPPLGQTSTQTFITSAVSLKGELLKFVSSVNTGDKLETWLLNVERVMKKTVKSHVKRECQKRLELKLVGKSLSAAAINAARVWWTARVESVFHGFQDEIEPMASLLNEYSHLLVETSELIRTHVSSMDRRKYSALLLQYISMRDTIQKLVTSNVLDRWDFEWQCQQRYYWMTELDSMVIEQCKERFEYGFEYDGSCERIVQTPLTTRAQFAIIQAISSKSGVMLSGPCGTGKKETIKDLAKILGVRCLIVNCVKSMTYSHVERILNSLFECEIWTCFDQFDQFDSTTLSVLSPQIKSRLKLNTKHQREIKMSLSSRSPHLFVVLQTNGSHMPESIITAFRSFAFMLPDVELICELLLLCEGFKQPKALSRKMCSLNRLAQKQFSIRASPLSLRVLCKIISSSGELLREADTNCELIIIKRALRDSIHPQLPPDDVQIFDNLLNDVFPGVYLKDEDSSEKEVISTWMTEKLFSIADSQVEKVVQLRNAKSMRAAIVIGSACSGKSTVIQACTEIDVRFGHFVTNYVFSPKAYSHSDLFGFVDEMTNEWNDGIISRICKKIRRGKSSDSIEKINLIFDGQIDGSWMENLSALMDESKTLTLANCDRIQLDPDYFIIFETGSLELASPAIISRALIVFMDAMINYAMVWSRWLRKRVDEREIQTLSIIFDALVPAMLTGSFWSLQSSVRRNEIHLIQQLCHVLEVMLPTVEEGYSQIEKSVSEAEVNCVFIEALYWSFGASFGESSREKFDALVKDFFLKFCREDLPSERPTLYNYFYSRDEARWIDWSTRVVDYIHNSSHFSEIVVPTEDNARNSHILELLIKHDCEDITYSTYDYRMKVHSKTKRPILFLGETGSLKTSLIGGYLNNLDTSHVFKVHCTMKTSSLEVQNLIESSIENQGRNTYGPGQGKKLIVFLDDLHMPKSDSHGSVQLLEFIRLLASKKGFYERGGKNGWKKVINTHIYGAWTISPGKQLEIDPRLSSQFSIFTMNPPSTRTARSLFTSILSGHFNDFPREIRDSIHGVATLTIGYIQEISAKLFPSPTKFYYEFNVRTLSQIVKSLLHASKDLYTSRLQILRLLRNEILRTVCDRILNHQDKAFAKDTLNASIQKTFPESNEYIWSEPILYGDFRNAMIDSPRLYEDLLDYNAAFHLFTEVSDKFKESGRLGLILFEEALEHLIRIHRILRQRGGHALIFGSAGTGKRSLIELASFGAGCSTHRWQLNNTHNIKSFANELKNLLTKWSTMDNLVLLLATEFDINEDILEAIFNLICRGLVPSCCVESESNENRNIISKFSYKEDIASLFKNHFHIVLSLSLSEQRSLAGFSSFFPGLWSRVYIDWVLPWSSDAYVTIANEYIKDEDSIEDKFKRDVMEVMCFIHEEMFTLSDVYFERTQQRNYVNPDHFLNFIREFIESIQAKKSSIIQQVQRLTEGIEKVVLLENQLLTLGTMLSDQKEKVKLKSLEIIKISTDLNEITEEFDEKQDSLKEKGQEITSQRKKLFQLQANLEKMLRVATPISISAKEVVENLEQESVSEISLMPIVPEPVQVVCECVAVLKGAEEIDWNKAKSLFEDPFLLAKLKDMDYNAISVPVQQLIKSHLKTSKRMSEMKDISPTGLGLLQFVENVLEYCTLYRDIKPKQEKLRCLEEELMKLTTSLEETSVQVEDSKVLIKSLTRRREELVDERDSLQKIADDMQEKYDLVFDLINRLKQKKENWEKRKQALELEEAHTLGNQLIEKAFINYTSFFDPIYRTEIVYVWLEKVKSTSILISEELKIENMIREQTRNLWATQGFEMNGNYMQNCLFVKFSSKIPIFLDPQNQACRFIEKQSKGLVQVQAYDSRLYDITREAMTTGRELLVTNYEEFNQTIHSALECGPSRLYNLRGETIAAHGNFKMYIIASVDAKLRPETFVKGCVINFDMTPEALEYHLTACANLIKNPENENHRRILLKEKHDDSSTLFEYDSRVLTDIGIIEEGKTDIFHGYESVSLLNELTIVECQVSERLKECEVQLDNADCPYRDIARKATILFKCLARMSLINRIYQFSFEFFQEIFKSALDQSTDLESISQNLLELTYINGCRGIFERDKLVFSLELILNLELLDLKITKEEVLFLLGEFESETVEVEATWITCEGKALIQKLADDLPVKFSRLPNDLVENELDWRKWVEEENCARTKIPGENSNYSQFDWLLLVKCFKKERIFQAVGEYAENILGKSFYSRNLSLQEIRNKGESKTPVIFFLAADSETEDLLGTLEFIEMDVIKIGIGEKEVEERVQRASSKGRHILLYNIHLSPSLLHRLDEMFENTCFHENFRLWATSEPSEHLPLSFLLKAEKVVHQTSPSLKLNLMNTFRRISNELSHPAFKTVVFALAFLHAVVSERKQVESPWAIDVNSQRHFNVSFLYLSGMTELNRDDKISWSAIKYFIGEISYGGCLRTMDDHRVIQTFVDEYFGDFLFESKQPFIFDRSSPEYTAPSLNSLDDYLDYIEDLPLFTPASVVGLSKQADVERNLLSFTHFRNTWATLQNVSYKERDATNEENNTQIIDEILSTLPSEALTFNYSTRKDIKPFDVFLHRDLAEFNVLTDKIRKELNILKEVIQGKPASPALHNTLDCLKAGRLPHDWRCFPPYSYANLGEWTLHLKKRIDHYRHWITRGAPWIVWLSGLCKPEAYMISLAQTESRAQGVSLDEIMFLGEITTFEEKKQIPKKPDGGCYVEGLILERVKWDRELLSLSDSFALIDQLPIVKVVPIQRFQNQSKGKLIVPVFVSESKKTEDDKLFELSIPVGRNINYWTVRKVYVVLNKENAKLT